MALKTILNFYAYDDKMVLSYFIFTLAIIFVGHNAEINSFEKLLQVTIFPIESRKKATIGLASIG